MKKIVLTLVALLSMTAVFAEEGEKSANKSQKSPEVTVAGMNQNMDMTLNYNTLASTLGLDEYQKGAVELIHNKFIKEMKAAASVEGAERMELVKKAANKELEYMSYVLNSDQYRKFNMLFNLTLSNRGLLD